MNSESSLIYEVWELFRDFVPTSKRNEYSISLLRLFEEFGFEGDDLRELLNEDDHLTSAIKAVFDLEADEDEEEEDY